MTTDALLVGRPKTLISNFGFRSDLMDKKKTGSIQKTLGDQQQELRRTVTRNQADGRSADEDTAQDIADRAASSYTKGIPLQPKQQRPAAC